MESCLAASTPIDRQGQLEFIMSATLEKSNGFSRTHGPHISPKRNTVSMVRCYPDHEYGVADAGSEFYDTITIRVANHGGDTEGADRVIQRFLEYIRAGIEIEADEEEPEPYEIEVDRFEDAFGNGSPEPEPADDPEPADEAEIAAIISTHLGISVAIDRKENGNTILRFGNWLNFGLSKYESHVGQSSAALRSRAADLVAAAEIIEERAGLCPGIGLRVGPHGTHSIQFDNDALEECEFLVWNLVVALPPP